MRKIEVATSDLNKKQASQVFSRCPRCKSLSVIHFDGEVICPDCGWDSIELSVESQISAHCARTAAQRSASLSGKAA